MLPPRDLRAAVGQKSDVVVVGRTNSRALPKWYPSSPPRCGGIGLATWGRGNWLPCKGSWRAAPEGSARRAAGRTIDCPITQESRPARHRAANVIQLQTRSPALSAGTARRRRRLRGQPLKIASGNSSNSRTPYLFTITYYFFTPPPQPGRRAFSRRGRRI